MWFASCGFYPHQLAPELCSYLGLMTKKLDDSKCDDGKIIGQVLKSEFHQLQPKKKKKNTFKDYVNCNKHSLPYC